METELSVTTLVRDLVNPEHGVGEVIAVDSDADTYRVRWREDDTEEVRPRQELASPRG